MAMTYARSRALSPASSAPNAAARQALLAAFAELVLSRRYRDFGVEAIIKVANVARSTFYYHFLGKDDLLLQNLQPLIAALARMPLATEPARDLEEWVAHIWQQRGVAGRLLTGATGARIEAALVKGLNETFAAQLAAESGQCRRSLLAEQIAGASLSLLKAWATHRVTATPPDIAHILWRGARAIVSASERAADPDIA